MIAVLANSRRQYDDFTRAILNRKDFFYANPNSIRGRDITGIIDICYEKDLNLSRLNREVKDKIESFNQTINIQNERLSKSNKENVRLHHQLEKVPKWVKYLLKIQSW